MSKTNPTDVSYPHDYNILAAKALEMINNDRMREGISPVLLSPIRSSQYHANSMLYYDFFSHWDINGYKPHLRYTLLNGYGSVFENISYESSNTSRYSSTGKVEDAIRRLQWKMLHNDKDWQDGHRKNILDIHHNRVSIGIAYDKSRLYFVEDFENNYIDFTSRILSSNYSLRWEGKPLRELKDMRIHIYYDSIPTPPTLSELRHDAKYSGAYDIGRFTGIIFQRDNFGQFYLVKGISDYNAKFKITPDFFSVEFSIEKFIKELGSGTYTICLAEDNKPQEIIHTTLSILVNVQICIRCGSSVDENARFCARCGNHL